MDWFAKEGERTICEDFDLKSFRSICPLTLHVLHTKKGIEIFPQNISGIISTPCGKRLYIAPKFPRLDPFAMYNICAGVPVYEFSTHSDEVLTKTYQAVPSTIAEQFEHELNKIQHLPLLFRRELKEENSESFRGRVNWQASMLGLKKKIISKPIRTKFFQPVYEIPENILIASAARKIIQEGANLSSSHILNFWARRIVSQLTDSHKRELRQILKESSIKGAHSYIYKALKLAAIIVGISYTDSGELIEGYTQLFNTPALYESFVRCILMPKLSLMGFTCQKGFRERGFLFTNNSSELIPDITIYRGEKVVAIADVKYKQPTNSDYYQMFTYCSFAGIKKGFIFTPAELKEDLITTYNGIKIQLIKIDDCAPPVLTESLDNFYSKLNKL